MTLQKNALRYGRKRAKSQQKGAVLLVAIIVLMAMTLAGLSMIRSVTSGQSAAGNLAFKQNATSAADIAVSQASADFLLKFTADKYYFDRLGDSYYATWDPSFDAVKFPWGTNNGTGTKVPGNFQSNDVSYVVHRMCRLNGAQNIPGQECTQPPDSGCFGGATGGVISMCDAMPVYRITARVQGPRNTFSYSQVMVY